MMMSKSLIAGALAGLLLSSGAFAQAAAPATPAAPAATTTAPAPAMGMSMDKKAISKACSDDATKQGLHGKARKAFRSKCKADKSKM